MAIAVPAPATPGSARNRVSIAEAKASRFSSDEYEDSASDRSNASARVGLKPGSIDAAFARLRSNRPAEDSRTTVSASSTMTSVACVR